MTKATDEDRNGQTFPTQPTDRSLRLSQAGPDEEPDPPSLLFPDVEAWVQAIFLPMFGWRIDGQRWCWCPQWWRHAEAIWRLELLWRSWEVARLHPTGMSSWSVEFDRHKYELLGEDSPFRQCRADDGDRKAHHSELKPATADYAPPSWWA